MPFLTALDLLASASRSHCLAICAGLVPLTFLSTAATLALTLLGRPLLGRQVRWSLALQTLGALLILAHDLSWFMIGVVMGPTFVLLFLASFALLVAAMAVWQREPLQRFLRELLRPVLARWVLLES